MKKYYTNLQKKDIINIAYRKIMKEKQITCLKITR